MALSHLNIIYEIFGILMEKFESIFSYVNYLKLKLQLHECGAFEWMRTRGNNLSSLKNRRKYFSKFLSPIVLHLKIAQQLIRPFFS